MQEMKEVTELENQISSSKNKAKKLKDDHDLVEHVKKISLEDVEEKNKSEVSSDQEWEKPDN